MKTKRKVAELDLGAVAKDHELLVAGDELANSMVPRADHYIGHAPVWYGWALRDAFWKGVMWQKQRDTVETEE